MDEIKKLPELQKHLDIYDAILTFRKTEQEKVVSIHIRYSKKGRQRKGRLPFPEDIDYRSWKWLAHQGEMIYVYHRKEKYTYIDMNNCIVPTDFGQKLENLVLKIRSGNSIDEEII